ncbi:hypothetical protein Mapa_002332 [Marchantia paleacea]|nr:hypothetical protein Mapa_002332 [Marchantia paleacea]
MQRRRCWKRSQQHRGSQRARHSSPESQAKPCPCSAISPRPSSTIDPPLSPRTKLIPRCRFRKRCRSARAIGTGTQIPTQDGPPKERGDRHLPLVQDPGPIVPSVARLDKDCRTSLLGNLVEPVPEAVAPAHNADPSGIDRYYRLHATENH